MPRLLIARYIGGVIGIAIFLSGASRARAQDIEPRLYSNAPVGVNFLVVGYAYTRGGLAFDPSLPLTNPQLETSSAVLAYTRAIDLWGLSAKIGAVIPYTLLSGSADYAGKPLERVVDGLADPKLRILRQPLWGTCADAQGV
jgi:hypothetical protein